MARVLRCSSCGAAVKYDIYADEMQCPFCGLNIPLFEMKQHEEEKNQQMSNVVEHQEKDVAENTGTDNKSIDIADGFDIEFDPLNNTDIENFSFDEKYEDLHIDERHMDYDGIKCNSCGAELIYDKMTVATKCAFCGSPNIISERLSGALKPDKIIPFRITKEKAKDIFKEWTHSNHYVPSSFTKEVTLDSMQGIYVPFFLYDYDIHSKLVLETERTDTHVENRPGIMGSSYNEVSDIKRFVLEKELYISYANIPVDATKRMPDKFMDNIEPYDYSWLRDFDMAYLSGFYAEKTNFESKEIEYRAKRKLGKFIDSCYEKLFSKVNCVEKLGDDKYIKTTAKKYALLPVWYLNYKYKDQDYIFMVNGQSGKYAGDLPISSSKVTAAYVASSFLYVLGYIVIILLSLLGYYYSLAYIAMLIPAHIATLGFIKKDVEKCKQSYEVIGTEYAKPLSYREIDGEKTLLNKRTKRRHIYDDSSNNDYPYDFF